MSIIKFVQLLFNIYFWMLFGRILISWFPDFQDNKLVQFVSYYTDPYLNLFRKIIPPFGMLDISPIFAFLGLGVIEYVVLAILKGFLR